MKKYILLMAVLALAVSCGLEEVGGRLQQDTGGVWVRPGVDVDSVSAEDVVTYITAMEYPRGYDWNADKERGEIKCSLVVYANGIPMMKIPVGDKYEVSSDPDTHRMINGHLYTCFASDSTTVIKRDGKERVRYSGREVICGLTECGDDVYSLGNDADGDGFSYRRNGEILLERKTGSTFGNLHQKGDSIFFAFREPIASEDQSLERYYYVLNGEVSQTALREDIKKVWDIVPYKGGICYLALLVGISTPVLCTSDGMQALSMPQNATMLDCSIICDGESLFVCGLFDRKDVKLRSGLWYSDGRIHQFNIGMTVSSSFVEGDCICCVLNPSSSKMKGIVFISGESHSVPDGFFSAGSRTAAMVGGILHVGLSSTIGRYPVIWKDDITSPLKINGFITSVSAKSK